MIEKLSFQKIIGILLSLFVLVFAADSQAQQTQVTGTVVTAEDGNVLPGVTVVVEDTDLGTVTDSDGNYEINVPSLEETLVFSFIGFQTQEIPIEGRATVNVEMVPEVIAGEEIVVTAFGIEREAKALTFSTQGVSTEEITEARELNVVTSLQGKVSGISINQSGSGVGAPARVVLRGNRSISGDSQPLYVLDGVPIRGNPQDLNPDDIQSIDVLKGPNAAALYGAAAQNGAIVINTKRGERGAVNVSWNTNFMVNEANLATDYQNEYGQGSGGSYSPGSEFSWGPRMDGSQVEFWTPDPNHSMAGQTYAFEPQPDNVSDVFRRGYNASTNLSASIGGDRTQTVFSYTYTNAQGIVPNNDLDRNNISVRVTSDLSDRLNLDSRLSYMRQVTQNQLSTGESFSNPIRNTYRMPRNIRTAHIKEFEYTDVNGLNRQHYWNPGSNGGNNPYWALNRNNRENTRERVIALAALTYDFSDAVSLMVRGAYDGAATDFEQRFWNDSYIIADNGSYSRTKGNELEWNGDFLLSYRNNITADIDIEANFGGNIMQRRNNSINANTGPSLQVPNFFALSNTLNPGTSENVGAPIDIQSLYAFGQVGWRNSIFLDLTGRNDWSSTLPSNNRSYFYPSAGLSVMVSELFSEFPEFFTFAKVRASWARVGNSAPPFMLNRTASFNAGGNAGFLQLSSVLPNQDLRPEETESFEIGADFRFFEGRLGVDATWYQTNTRNQLFTVALPVGSGASSFFTNGGDVENKGIELLLTATPVQTTDVSWDVTLNYARNRNMVVAISDERPSLSIAQDFLREFRIEEGRPYGEVYSRGFERDDQGRVIVGSDGMPRITPGLNVPVANFNPDWTGGITTIFSYRNLSATFVIDHRQGGSIASMSNAVMFADGVTKQTLEGREGGLIFGDNFFSHETAVDENGNPNTAAIVAETFWRGVGGRNAPVGEVFVDEATNTRLREMTIGYNLPASLLDGIPVSSLKLSLVGRNLFFIYRASDNLDPDLMVGTNPAAEGFESFAPPTTRTIGFNLKVDF